MKSGAVSRLRKNASDQTADNGTGDPEESTFPETEMESAGQKKFGKCADDGADDDGPDDV